VVCGFSFNSLKGTLSPSLSLSELLSLLEKTYLYFSFSLKVNADGAVWKLKKYRVKGTNSTKTQYKYIVEVLVTT
jgi:hypothetical protein